MEVITRDAIIDGKVYKVRPGLKYEIAPGVVATLKEDTIALVREVSALRKADAKDDKPLVEIALEQAKLILTVPAGWSDWDAASPKVVWRACQDFLLLTLPTEQPQT